MRIRCVTGLAALLPALMLVGCGGGGGGGSTATNMPPPTMEPDDGSPPPQEPVDPTPPPPSPPEPKPPTSAERLWFPFRAMSYADRLLVGIDQGIEYAEIAGGGGFFTQGYFDLRSLRAVTDRGDIEIRHGQVSDGVGSTALKRYLREGLRSGSGDIINRFSSPVTVQIIGQRATASDVSLIERAIDLVNASLPDAWDLRIGSRRPDVGYPSSLHWRTANDTPANTIYVELLPHRQLPTAAGTTSIRYVLRGSAAERSRIENAYVTINRDNYTVQGEGVAVNVVAHELIHALGVDGHVSTSASIMNHDSFVPEYLYPADREALRARYGRLSVGDTVDDLGPWSETSLHLHGSGVHAGFGVALRNGYAEPWAYGLRPTTTLASNRGLSGSATWSGTLLGLTPSAEAVAGDAEIGVNLATMRGTAEFTALESWAARAAPGAAGTGTRWGDGGLAYTISVNGNTFHRTGGDAGTLTGIFTGRSHEGAAGTLERSDLTAAFGASR